MPRPPSNEIPIQVPIRGIINGTPDLVFALTSVEVYSVGVRWTIDIFKRVPTLSLGAYGFGRPETSGTSAAPHLLGFEWADGTISSNMPRSDNNSGGLHFHAGGGGSDSRRHRRSVLWLDHLPPAGPFLIITAWPFFDILERQVAFDATAITVAAQQAEQLWEPVDATLRSHDDMPRVATEDAQLVMPRTGWFGEHFDSSPPPPRLDEHGNELHYRAVTWDAEGNEIPLRPQPPGWRLADPDETAR